MKLRLNLFRGGLVLNGSWKLSFAGMLACVAALLLCNPLSAQEKTTAEQNHAAAHDDHNGDHSEGHGGDHHGEYSIKGDLPLWSLVAFIGFILAIKVLGLWDLLLNSMSSREQAETQAISSAEADLAAAQNALRGSKGRLEALDERIRETMAEADRDATSTRDEILSLAKREADASVERATHEIERVRDQSLNEIFESLSDKVTEATESRLRHGLNTDDHDRLITSMLGDLAIR